MFGSQDNNQGAAMPPMDNNLNPTPYQDNSAPAAPAQDMGMPSTPTPSDMNSSLSPVPDLTSNVPTPQPVMDQEVASADLTPNLESKPSDNPDLEDLVLPGSEAPKTSDMDSAMSNPMTSGETSDLDEIKNKALKEITPLLDKLDLPALEKFKTIMMTIQAGDSKELIPSAYEAAEKIEDESQKAQALLDIINEINYFSNNKK